MTFPLGSITRCHSVGRTRPGKLPYLTGDRATWTSFDDDKTYGPVALKADRETTDPVETKKLRAAFKDFLNCMSVHCPTNFTKTVQREATSWSWIIKLIKDNYNLNTKGEQLLGGNDIKLEFDDNFSKALCT